LGVDGSKIILPNTSDIEKEFGSVRTDNGRIEGSYTSAMFECCYDVLNHLAIGVRLSKGDVYEVEEAKELLSVAKDSDLLIYDRGYCSYEFFCTLEQQKKQYLIRCPRNSFKVAKEFFSGKCVDAVRTLKAPRSKRAAFKALGLPLEIRVRFIAVILSTGETEVLITSVKDPTIVPEDFKYLYGLRWGAETFFGTLKGRLSLENFTGLTAESVKQDFWSTILISNYETIVTSDINEDFHKAKRQKVNKAVAFNIIKHEAFNILFNDAGKENTEATLQRLEKLFKTASVLTRQERSPPRKTSSPRRSYNFLLRKKKQVF
jgi:hypothetical protein